MPDKDSAPRVSRGIRSWWSRLDGSVKAAATLLAFAGFVAAAVRTADQYVSANELSGELQKVHVVDEKQEEDIDLLFQTQVRLVTSVESLKEEVHEVRKDLRALDAGRPLPPLRAAVEHEEDH